MTSHPNFDPTPISNRRRWLILLLPALISLIGLVVLFFVQQQLTPGWQTAMERYQSEQADAGNVFEVMAVVTALLPAEYDANEPFRPAADSIAVDLPVAEIRCVEIRPEADADQRMILLLLRNQDGTTPNDWQIYEATGNGQQVQRTVAEIGCFFPNFDD
ncbi:MAG: hypothetical protein R2873_31190 [Caldilineaceae bacterium]|nr:hypothetical protein [Caldilineaceae bacterium]